jgi:hypothetical protein
MKELVVLGFASREPSLARTAASTCRHRSRFHPSLQVATGRRRAIVCVDVLGGLIHEFRRAA